jgi:hypothetical protein
MPSREARIKKTMRSIVKFTSVALRATSWIPTPYSSITGQAVGMTAVLTFLDNDCGFIPRKNEGWNRRGDILSPASREARPSNKKRREAPSNSKRQRRGLM